MYRGVPVGDDRAVRRPALLSLILILLFSGCRGGGSTSYTLDFFAMDTYVRLEVFTSDEKFAERALCAAKDEFLRVGAMTTRFEDGASENGIYALNSSSGSEVETGEELSDLLKLCVSWSEKTGGAFDVTVGALSELWSFGVNSSPPPAEAVEEALAFVGYGKIEFCEDRFAVRLPPGVKLDLGAVAKGYAADRVVSIWREMGVESALVDAGGNIFAVGHAPAGRPWQIGIAHPRKSGELWKTINVTDASVVTSGDYQRNFIGDDGILYHHIFDPATGYPARSSISVTVAAGNSTEADILSTALFVLGEEKLGTVTLPPGTEVYFYSD